MYAFMLQATPGKGTEGAYAEISDILQLLEWSEKQFKEPPCQTLDIWEPWFIRAVRCVWLRLMIEVS
jgi:hypothetical protein